jgi:hypothetical protein
MAEETAPNVVNIQMAKYNKIESIERETPKGWVEYGEGNVFPQYLIDLYTNSSVHGSLINSIAFMIAGKGFQSMNQATTNQIEAWDLNTILPCIAIDLKMQGGFYLEFIMSMDMQSIAQINHLPFENCRRAVSDENDCITGIWYSRDWEDTRKVKNKPEFVPIFDPLNPCARQVIYCDMLTPGSLYYPRPDYYSAINWIELTKHISEFHVNNILNGLFPSFHIAFTNGTPNPEAERKIIQELERNISGTSNAGKFFATFNRKPEEAPIINPFPTNEADKTYDYLSTEARDQIIVAHRVTSPILLGVRDGGGLGSNTDEMKTALQIFSKQVIEPFQRIIIEGLMCAFEFNGVPAEFDIAQNDVLMQEQAVVSDTTGAPTSVDVASQAMNGAQIASLLEIIVQTTAKVLTIPSAKAITKASFPMLSQEQIDSIFDNLSPVQIDPTQVVQSEKKKDNSECLCMSAEDDDFSPSQEQWWVNHLDTIGEQLSEDDWELVNEERLDDMTQEHDLIHQMQGSGGYKKYASGLEKRSRMDAGMYKIRYAYTLGLRDNSREFCKKMVAMSQKGIVFRWEDLSIDSPEFNMSDSGVNSQFAAAGESTYNIWKFKGGKNCYHAFRRLIFKRKLATGKGQKGFLPDDPENYTKIGVIEAVIKGVPLKDISADYATAATPTRLLD